jgi:polar amino acid transport system ATP-binding protein
MALLEARNIRKSFGYNEVLKGVDVTVEQGEVLSIIGPSGGGKSTLLRCLTGLETPDSGEIRMEGRVGLVFQNFNLFPHWSVLKNISDPQISILGKSREEADAFSRELLAQVELADKEDAYPYQLSGGQQQRVAIARTLGMSPKIIFFDEPTSALDPELTAGILKVIRKLADQHMTMVIVTHEMAFAKAVSDQVIFLAGGVIVEQGTPAQVFDSTNEERTRKFLDTFKQ